MISRALRDCANPVHAAVLRAAAHDRFASARELGEPYGMRAEAVRWVFWRYGIKRGRQVRRREDDSPRRRAYLALRAEQTRALLHARKLCPFFTLSELAAACEVPAQRAKRILMAHGIVSLPERSGWTPASRAKLLYLRDAKRMSGPALAKRYRCSTSTIYEQLSLARYEAKG